MFWQQRRSFFALALWLATISAASGASATTSNWDMTCADSLGSGAEAENKQLRAQPTLLKRVAKHDLIVNTAVGPVHFRDKPPYDEAFDGTAYFYCMRKDHFHLLFKSDGNEFGGVLLDDRNGKVTPAGQEILFSPDKRAYLATAQPDGLDGQRWRVYAIDGRLSWNGFSFIPDLKKEGQFIAELTEPSWTAQGQLQAKARCVGDDLDKTTLVTLTKREGTWQWLPRPRCKLPG